VPSGGQRRFWHLLISAVVMLVAAAVAIGATIYWLRSDAIENAYRDTTNISIVLSGQVSNAVQSIDLILKEIRTSLQTKANSDNVPIEHLMRADSTHQLLLDRLSHLPQAVLIGLIDGHGKLANSTHQRPIPDLDVSKTGNFVHFQTNVGDDLYISNLQVAKLLKERVVFLSRKITTNNGTFAGVVVVGVGLRYFESIYRPIASLEDQSFLLLHRDGGIIARFPDAPTANRDRMPIGSPWYGLVAKEGGRYRSPGYFDARPRLVSVRPLKDYPLVVNVGVSEEEALRAWRLQAVTIAAGALLAMLCSALLLSSLVKQYRLLEKSQDQLLKKSTALEEANLMADAALNNMSQGLVMFDSENRLIVSNRRYLLMYGMDSDLVKPGTSLQNLIKLRISKGHFLDNDPERYIASIIKEVAGGAKSSRLAHLPDGRIIEVANHPIQGGGWVATHEDVTEKKAFEEKIAYAAYHDALTGLCNRKLFSERLDDICKGLHSGKLFALLYIDLDHLKDVNDTLGHPIGDKLLRGAAERMLQVAGGSNVVGRLGGDEFAIIQVDLDEASAAADLAAKIRDTIRKPFEIDGLRITIDLSVGISIAPADGIHPDDILKAADIALYEAKNAGRGIHRFYHRDMDVRLQERSLIGQELRDAIPNGELELYYQPIIALSDGQTKSVEALLRWNHPTRGFVEPAKFIPIAEESGMIVPIGEWVLRSACAEAVNWPEHISVAVNVSADQVTDPHFGELVISSLAYSGLKPLRLTLEITETVFLKSSKENLETLRSLHQLGVQLAMDDFGTGYSSLSYLLDFPFNTIKIDRSFVSALSHNKKSRAIAKAVVNLARSLHLDVIAEGIETEDQLERLRKLGCSQGQGYLLGRPTTTSKIRKRLELDLHEVCPKVA
jgi:diguanylate cyclase (GGDEF)-like protein